MGLKVVSWNINGSAEAWRRLVEMDADLALLQEASTPPEDVAERVEVDPAMWPTDRKSRGRRTAIAKLSDRVSVEWIEAKPLENAEPRELGVSRRGTLTAARVSGGGVEAFLAISMYATWEHSHSSTGNWEFADGSAHRVVSDLSVFAGRKSDRILAAGDLNIYRGYGESGDLGQAARYWSVFERMEALGFAFAGPQAPNGWQAEPWPDELPRGSKNVPTHRTSKGAVRHQLDFVFASRGMTESVQTRALNEPDEWGPSDHCRVVIDLA